VDNRAAVDMNNPLLEAALEFASAGVPVAAAKGKNPGAVLGRGWQNLATTDHDTIVSWWAQHPDANPGIVPGDTLAALDVDDPDSFRVFQGEHGYAPPTPRYYTNGAPGRERVLFQHPERQLGRTYLANGVQVRDGSLFSVIPPAINPSSGQEYEWRDRFDETPLATFPAEWLAVAPERKPVTLEEFTTPVYEKKPGHQTGRHERMLRIAGSLAGRGLEPRVVYELLCGFNQRFCRPPKDEAEVAALVRFTFEKERAL
jgi:hypothetical protein